ncbi:MAG: acyl-CoA dehydratase activase [Kiritimatiellia bacterium]|jgi:predicted CoA-substrate-specific enzyme activase|nr:acyl-CoA dehydratase activase [Kiritimatiellia bacterium]
MQYFCGIDIGASTAKLVIVDENGDVAARSMQRSGVDYTGVARENLDEALAAADLAEDDVSYSVSTGYGRDNVPWSDESMTEIACHGKGAWFNFRRQITVIDIGAQDSKVIHLDDKGRRTSFKMNRKCAAGTGSFLEEIALRLALPASELNGLAEQSTKDVTLGSFCTVFTATEILAKIRAGEKVEDIAKGAFRSIVKRVSEMDTIDGELVMTGGVVAHNPLLVSLVGEFYGRTALVPPDPQYTGAFGAALFAMEKGAKTC